MYTIRPAESEYAPFYAGYVASVPEGDIIELLRANGAELDALLRAVPEEQGGHRYGDGKWTVREVVGHMIDAERIFAYRLLRIGRGDKTPLPGFEESAYVVSSGSDARMMAALVHELELVRASTVALLESLPADAWTRLGTASGQAVSTRALAWITAGHAMHHVKILRERYGLGAA